jgi:hypothetical protein
MQGDIKIGTHALVVSANGDSLEAQITRVRGDGMVDVLLMHNGKEIEIHSCPRDDTGKKPDSWRPAPSPYDVG